MTAIPLGKAFKRTAAFHAREAFGLQHRPLKLRLALTQRCNARCKMCNAWQIEGDRADETTPEEIRRLFHENAAFFKALRHVSLTGGEPSLRRDLGEIIETVNAARPAASINVNTNGFLTGRIVDTARETAMRGIVSTWNVSLDALDALHDAMRGVPGASDRARATLEALAGLREEGLRVKIGVNHVLTEENAHAAEAVHAYACSIGASFNPIMPMTGEIYGNEGASFDLSLQARETLAAFFERLIAAEPPEALAYAEILRQLRGEARDFDCWAGRILFLIEENGDVFPNGGCPRIWRLGNLREFGWSFTRLLASENARSILQQTLQCRSCRLACETLTTLKHPEALAGRRKTPRVQPPPD